MFVIIVINTLHQLGDERYTCINNRRTGRLTLYVDLSPNVTIFTGRSSLFAVSPFNYPTAQCSLSHGLLAVTRECILSIPVPLRFIPTWFRRSILVRRFYLSFCPLVSMPVPLLFHAPCRCHRSTGLTCSRVRHSRNNYIQPRFFVSPVRFLRTLLRKWIELL